MHGGNGTPPHHPAFGVHISDDTITALLGSCLPLRKISSIIRIPHDRSYNNRIFVIHFEGSDDDQHAPCVLKVNGRFFGWAKVENETACLLLLNRYCPRLPVPKVLAWSEDGGHVSRQDESGVFTRTAIQGVQETKCPSWILMTHLPGSPLDTSTLATPDMKLLAEQIANAVATWRQAIPAAHCAANLHFRTLLESAGSQNLYRTETLDFPDMHIYGNIGSGNDRGEPARSLLSFWRIELEWQRTQLATKPAFTANRDALLEDLCDFIKDTLPKLSLFQTSSPSALFIFTHTDLFPRNILVSGSPPQLTGIVDFEFSGFFPAMEEFVQDWDPDPFDDGSEWPAEMYEMIMTEMERLSELTPRKLEDRERKEMLELSRMRYFVAPWWIEQGEEEESGKDLERARREVKKAIAALEAMVRSRG